MIAIRAIDEHDMQELARLVPQDPGSGVSLVTDELERVGRDVACSESRERVFDLLDDYAETLVSAGQMDGPPSLLEKFLVMARGTAALSVLDELDDSAPQLVLDALTSAIEEETRTVAFIEALRQGLLTRTYDEPMGAFIAQCIQELNNERLARAAIRQLGDSADAPRRLVFESK